jgi:hypothetical protein
MIVNDKQMYRAGQVLLVIIAILAFLYSTSSNAQTYSVEKLNDRYIIDFKDEFIDNHYFNGERIYYYGKLDLSENEYKQLIKDIKKSLKQNETEIDRPNYAVLKFGWVNDTVWVYRDEKAFSVTKKDIKILNNKL